MNIESVFRLKASTASFQNFTQNVNQASSPVLQSLEEDRKFNRGFEFGLINILKGKFNEAVIDSLVDPTFIFFKGLDVLEDKKNFGRPVLSSERTALNILDSRSLNLTPSDAEILKKLFRINSENKKTTQDVRSNLNAINFALKNILNGNFGEEVIDSLVDPSFDGVGDLENKSGGDARDIKGKIIKKNQFPEIESLNLSPNDAEILKKIFQTKFNNQQLAQEAKFNLNAINFALKNRLFSNLSG